MKTLPQNYNHKETEKKWQQIWQEKGIYNWNENASDKENFVIDTPPPTVSGLLHMGHIFSYTQADFIARYKRMSGKAVFYPMGFDDNGLPTERLVEKVKKVRASDMSREDFIKICKEVVVDAEEEFRRLFRSVALSVDWNQEYQTISEESRKISQMSFLDLFTKARAYRKLQPMLWDPIDQTAIAQAEIEDKELTSSFNDIYFGIEGSSEKIIIGTTRPELIPACVAVFYHPDDERYQHLKGKNAVTALFGVKVPILADDKVDREKGTGLVMCCTYGDEADIYWWQKHKLATRIVLNKYGKLDYLDGIGDKHELTKDVWESVDTDKAQQYACQIKGLKTAAARDKILQIIKEQNLLVKSETITHAVKCAERSGAPLEILPTNQWFIKILDIKDELKQKANECKWHPDFMRIRMEQWIDGLNWDWCISRQRYFGVPFPIWYSKRKGEEGKIIVADKDQLPVDPLVDLPNGYSKDEIEPEKDIMDTWATSSVSPQLSSKGIAENFMLDEKRHKKLFPADVRPQAHEIIRTWAFYTIVKAYLHQNTIPWKNLMISGWCLAPDKTKMSKSKGNVVTPVNLIEERGADVVRFWASTSKPGADTAFSEDVLKIGKKLVTKLWNATKFASIHLEHLTKLPDTPKNDIKNGIICETLDIWALSKLQQAIDKATKQFECYEYSNARAAAEDFFWNVFCDNYLEIVKVRVYGEAEGCTAKGRISAQHTIYHCIEGILKLFTPFIPHITDELYSHIFADKTKESGGSINCQNTWPILTGYIMDEDAVKSGDAIVSILNAIRKIKAEKNISIKAPVSQLIIENKNKLELKNINNMFNDLKNVTNAAEIIVGEAKSNATINSEDGLFKISAIFIDDNKEPEHKGKVTQELS